MPAPDSSSHHRPIKSGSYANPIYGILILILSSWALSTLDASGKWIMAAGASLLLMCWMRYVVHLALVLILVLPGKGIGVFKAKRPGAQFIRGFVMLVATLTFFTALSYLPQAEATAINFLAPLLVLSTAPWLLKEPPKRSRWIAAAVGFLGVLIIIRPGSGLHWVGVFFGLITACMFAIQFIVTRRVAIDHAMTTLVWSGLVGAIGTTALLPFYWDSIVLIMKQLSAFEWLILSSTGFWGAIGHLLQIQAYQHAPASMLAPFAYLQIVGAAALGWIVWGHFPDTLTWIGIGVVCGSGIVIGFIEWRQQQRAKRHSV